MVITDTPRSLAMSFIRVLMIVIQDIEPQGAITVYDDSSERTQRPFPKLRGPRSPGIRWPSAVFLLTSITLPIIVHFRVPIPRARAPGNSVKQIGRLEISDHGMMRSQDES